MSDSPTLIWTAHCRFGQTHYTSGIYKMTSYKNFRNRWVDPYWTVYKLAAVNWGDYLYPHLQGETMMTMDECKAMAQKHQDEFGEATKARKAVGEAAMERWVGAKIA